MFLSKTYSICRKKPFWLKNSDVEPQTTNLKYENEKEIKSEIKESWSLKVFVPGKPTIFWHLSCASL